MVGTLEELGGKTRDLPLRFPRRGPAFRPGRRRTGEVPHLPADAGKLQRLPGSGLLRDVQPLPPVAGGAAHAGGRDIR